MISKYKEFIKIDNQAYWNDLITRYEFSAMEKFIGKGNFMEIFPSTYWNDKIYVNQSNYLMDEYKFLKSNESATINKLRTEHINLNNYTNYYFKKQNFKENLCKHCQVATTENVNHFLFECPTYQKQRNKWLNN